ncbi:MAG: hypothetical protein D6725_01155 [Planctomycetota bacterium]|nr:MAG: hypothetical protein D6725_01155 [Planctomycetota bacterium]
MNSAATMSAIPATDATRGSSVVTSPTDAMTHRGTFRPRGTVSGPTSPLPDRRSEFLRHE